MASAMNVQHDTALLQAIAAAVIAAHSQRIAALRMVGLATIAGMISGPMSADLLRRRLCPAARQPLWPACDPQPIDSATLLQASTLIDRFNLAAASESARPALRGWLRAALRTSDWSFANIHEITSAAQASDAHTELATELLATAIDERLGTPSCRLAVYGTLAPGERNHGVLADCPGEWRGGAVRGELRTWRGYPVLAPKANAPGVAVRWLSSPLLPGAWARIDAFEGPRYRRVLAVVETDQGCAVANVYADASASAPRPSSRGARRNGPRLA